MSFYRQISKYYDYIFPLGQQQLDFIIQSCNEKSARILDIACGTGTYSIELAKRGYRVSGIDLDSKMIEVAKEKAALEGLDIEFLNIDMSDIDNVFKEKFDCIFCIGNSIAHLTSIDEIAFAISKMHLLLKEGGALIIQIVNFDRILHYNIDFLPTIQDKEKGLKFIRRYDLNAEKGIISFNTTLLVKNERDDIELTNSVELLPLKSSHMKTILNDAGFSKVELYGGFDFSPFHLDSFLLVTKSIK